MTLPGVVVICLTSLIGLPLTYSVNLFKDHVSEPLIILAIGGVVLVTIAVLPYLYARNTDIPKKDPFFYVWSLFTFACVVDLIIALENEGIIHSFMAFYLLEGEPYFKTTHGTFINYWDGIGHYALYIYILIQGSYNEKYRKAGLYWVGSITNSLFLIFIAGVIGKYGTRWPILLNLPYLFIPVWMGYKFLTSPPHSIKEEHQSDAEKRTASGPIQHRPTDLLFIVFFVAAICVHMLRASAVLGSPAQLAKDYLQYNEPYLMDGVGFPKAQMLVYAFYFVPYYVVAIFDLLYPNGRAYIVDWSLIMAGAIAEGQFSYMGASLHPDTPLTSQLPQDGHAHLVFWLVNGALFVIPHLYAYRCVTMATTIPSNEDISCVSNGNAILEVSESKEKEHLFKKNRISAVENLNTDKYNLRSRQKAVN